MLILYMHCYHSNASICHIIFGMTSEMVMVLPIPIDQKAYKNVAVTVADTSHMQP